MLVAVAGFRVSLDALRAAADGVDGLLANVHAPPLEGGEYGPSVVGDARLAAAVDAFRTRWRVGVDLLARDAEAVATLLRDSVAAYEHVDGAAAGGFVAGAGRDPAAD